MARYTSTTKAPATRGAHTYPRPWRTLNPAYKAEPVRRFSRQVPVIDKVTGEQIATRTQNLVEIDGGSFVDADQF